MKEFIKKIFKGHKFIPPLACLDSFASNFAHAINVEWFGKGEDWEVIFYRNSLEHIAIFTKNGELREYRMFLPVGSLPELIKIQLEQKGEIMSQVLVNKGNTIHYEAIVRDKKLARYLVELTDLGKVVKERLL